MLPEKPSSGQSEDSNAWEVMELINDKVVITDHFGSKSSGEKKKSNSLDKSQSVQNPNG